MSKRKRGHQILQEDHPLSDACDLAAYEVDADLRTLLSEQRRELTAAQTVESDLHFSYHLQMLEAVNASLSQKGDVASSSNPTFSFGDVPETTAAQLLADDISNFEQQLFDRRVAEDEMKKIRNDLNRRIHDQAFAREILNVPDEEWEEIGDNIEKPFREGSVSAKAKGVVESKEDCFRIHVKGLMSAESAEDEKRETFVGGIGVAIFDMNDVLIFEASKGVVGGEMNGEVVELKALIEGLHFAAVFGLKRVVIFSDSDLLYQCVMGKLCPKYSNVASLVNQVTLLQRNLTYCNLSLVAQNDINFVFELAQDAIVSQAREPVLNNCGKKIIETCAICLEDVNANRMFLIEGCLHRYCFSCMRRHVEVKLLQGMLPKCPHEKCMSELKTDDCKNFLMPELFDILCQHVMETSIPPAKKVYCPYRTCSALLSTTWYEYAGMTTERIICRKCHRPFCRNCKVPWHDDMTCSVYKQQNPYPCAEDAKFKSLATRRLWRQCGECNHMVSLAEGCNHVYCRCGHEFCYICGAAWKDKKATCACPLWDENNIIYN